MAANYYKIIRTLIEYKEELKFIEVKKLQPLINILQKYEIPPDDEDYHVPSNNELAEILKTPKAKVNLLIRELFKRITEYFSEHPIEINRCEQTVCIYLPFDEEKKELLKKDPYFYNKFSLYIKVNFPVLPRIGELISFDGLENDFGINRGHIYDIEHSIQGKTHKISIMAHPIHNYYFHWKKLEEEYEDEQRWIKMEAWRERNKT